MPPQISIVKYHFLYLCPKQNRTKFPQKQLNEELQCYDEVKTKIVVVDEKIEDVETLFKMLYEELCFPDYFGCNWNALNDCLRDFCWLQEDFVVFVVINKYKILSKEPSFQRDAFFEYLQYASDFWDDPNDEFGYKQNHPNLVFNVYYVED